MNSSTDKNLFAKGFVCVCVCFAKRLTGVTRLNYRLGSRSTNAKFWGYGGNDDDDDDDDDDNNVVGMIMTTTMMLTMLLMMVLLLMVVVMMMVLLLLMVMVLLLLLLLLLIMMVLLLMVVVVVVKMMMMMMMMMMLMMMLITMCPLRTVLAVDAIVAGHTRARVVRSVVCTRRTVLAGVVVAEVDFWREEIQSTIWITACSQERTRKWNKNDGKDAEKND